MNFGGTLGLLHNTDFQCRVRIRVFQFCQNYEYIPSAKPFLGFETLKPHDLSYTEPQKTSLFASSMFFTCFFIDKWYHSINSLFVLTQNVISEIYTTFHAWQYPEPTLQEWHLVRRRNETTSSRAKLHVSASREDKRHSKKRLYEKTFSLIRCETSNQHQPQIFFSKPQSQNEKTLRKDVT